MPKKKSSNKVSPTSKSKNLCQNNKTKKQKSDFLIVGIGASAGGLHAIQAFIQGIPPKSGLAYIIVQHLDPTHKGMLIELLQGITKLNVHQITHRMTVKPDNIYVIPPNKDLSLVDGTLYLIEPLEPRGLRLPIDFFFRSLAQDKSECSIGVILSGMGSDGTLGLRAIKEHAGLTFVQSPNEAEFDSMPQSAIRTGLADIIVTASKIPQKIIEIIKSIPKLIESEEESSNINLKSLKKIIVLLRLKTGHDFSLYKHNTIMRRIERRIALHQLTKMSEYLNFIRANDGEANLLFKELLIGVTSFFRDPAVWDEIQSKVIPQILRAHPEGGSIRAWVPACSTGEEAYTLAILFNEAMDRLKTELHYELQIFATDLDEDAIKHARQGIYPINIKADLTDDQLKRNFIKERDSYRVLKKIRDMVIFAPQNLVMDPPFTKLDFISCRNILIYLTAELQKTLTPLFHYSLNPGGVLLLGSAETVGNAPDLFSNAPGNFRIYYRCENNNNNQLPKFTETILNMRKDSQFPQASSSLPLPNDSMSISELEVSINQMLLQKFSPAAVIATKEGEIVYINGSTGSYLELAPGRIQNNIFRMGREKVGEALSGAFIRALSLKECVEFKRFNIGKNRSTKYVDIIVHPLFSPKPLMNMVLVTFKESVAPIPAPLHLDKSSDKKIKSSKLAELTRDLAKSQQQLITTREEMQTSQEELKSTNEELQSMNEELQSTNEELTTSKEEMQSMNEELQTVNQELSAKLDELSHASDDMKNLLNSTDIATLFLDNELKVRRFTTQTTKVINLIPSDAGRPITDIVTILNYSTLAEDVSEVLRTLIIHEVQVSAKNKRWYTVRIMPYRTQDNRIDGVVITFMEITMIKERSEGLKAAQDILTSALEACQLPIVIQQANTSTIQFANKACLNYTSSEDRTRLGDNDPKLQVMSWQYLDINGKSISSDHTPMSKSILQNEAIEMDMMIRQSDSKPCVVRAHSAPISKLPGLDKGSITVLHDITKERMNHDNLMAKEEDFKTFIEALPVGIIYYNHNAKPVSLNNAAEQIMSHFDKDIQKMSLDKTPWEAVRIDGQKLSPQKHPVIIALKTGEPSKNVILGMLNKKTNEHQWLSVNVTPLFKRSEKKPAQIYLTIEDISAYKAVHEVLSQSIHFLTNKLSLDNTDIKASVEQLLKKSKSCMDPRFSTFK